MKMPCKPSCLTLRVVERFQLASVHNPEQTPDIQSKTLHYTHLQAVRQAHLKSCWSETGHSPGRRISNRVPSCSQRVRQVGTKEVSVLMRMFCSLFLHVLAGSYMHAAS